ncbi:hypothetical protein OKA05_26940 [Luteolibacter arcticus]|uniref:Uncharacterized protein n=1 Tax=Luteolibacter arcticus TaxID=1581411 RepID=A0ABT3GRY4_9BACT|nr:hypothetical protein [Luteolibacter arcticus]MCW1926223.1 hypothetical protein [Luteolibacter arcticus]
MPAILSLPQAVESGDPPRFVSSSLADCRIGDWHRPEQVVEWWGLKGVQRFQPPGRFEDFDWDEPVWSFKREPDPTGRKVMGVACAVWRRIG